MKDHDFDSGHGSNPARQLNDPRVVEALDEYLAALEAGEKLDRQLFLSRHSEIADVLAECLEGMEALHSPQSAIRNSPSAGRGAMEEVGQRIGDSGWQPGTPLGDYQILREIGRGGMGIVYEAEQLSLGRRVALKVLPFALTLDPRQLQRFKNEARAAAQLHHQHIVPVYAVSTERGVHFYAMQYIEGQSLAEVIHDLRQQGKPEASAVIQKSGVDRAVSTGPYVPQSDQASRVASAPRETSIREAHTQITSSRGSTATPPVCSLATSYSSDSRGFYRTVARLGIQAAEALEHAHEYGVVHRDIKPGNLMVDAHGHLWVTDFGLAQFQTDVSLTRSGDLLGTLRYMSPEQANGQHVALDPRTDIYSLGVTLYELLTLHPPFEGSNRHTLLHQIVNEEPRSPRVYQKLIPVELETIVLKALAKAPAERYASAREMADDLSRFLQDKPIRARRATALQRVRKWGRRHPSILWSAVILCMLTAAGSLVAATMINSAYQLERTRKKEAEERFKLARDAVDGMFNLFEEELANKPFLDGLRRRLLEDYFLVYYGKLIDQSRDDPRAKKELEAMHYRVQEILGNLAVLQGFAQYNLLNNVDVLLDLQANDEQSSRLSQLTKIRIGRREEPWNLSSEQRLGRFLEEARWRANEAKRLLTAEQQKRLRQIDLQLKGPRAFEEEDVIQELHLDPEQRRKIREIQAQDFRAAFGDCHPHPPGKQDGPPAGLPGHFSPRIGPKPPFDPIEQIISVLTKEQKQKWQELTGQPFRATFKMHPKGPPGAFGPPQRH